MYRRHIRPGGHRITHAPAKLLSAGRILFLLILSLALSAHSLAATYWVATNGDDSGPGSSERPWKSIRHAVRTAAAGDSVTVLPGSYDERVTTVRGGTSSDNRIRIAASGLVVMKGWVVDHPYVTVRGFHITGHTSAASTDSPVRVNGGGSHFQLLDCFIGDGYAIKRDDFTFTAPNRIASPSGGFLQSGFFPGQTISLRRGTNVSILSPNRDYVVRSVDDNNLTVAETTIVNQGPVPAYITGSPNFALSLASLASGALIQGNTFSNLAFTGMLILGSNHVFRANKIVANNGWDAMVVGGTDLTFQLNTFRDFGWGNFSPSADVIDNFGNTPFRNVHFSSNFVQNIVGVIAAQKALPNRPSGPLVLSHNVFVDVGFFWGQFPDTRIEHNIFLRVARNSTPAVQVERHALVFDTANYATNAVIRNNMFVDCGQATGATTQSGVGWYRFIGPSQSVSAIGNYVAGAPPLYSPKIGWPESDPVLNGGDPGFVNVEDPLGPDQLPFTDDDGLQFSPDSRLLKEVSTENLPGPYQAAPIPIPQLTIASGTDGSLILRWPNSPPTWRLQTAFTLGVPWGDATLTPTSSNGANQVTISPTNASSFFRLAR